MNQLYWMKWFFRDRSSHLLPFFLWCDLFCWLGRTAPSFSTSPYRETNYPPINPYLSPSPPSTPTPSFCTSFLWSSSSSFSTSLLLLALSLLQTPSIDPYLSFPLMRVSNPPTPPSSTPHTQHTSSAILQLNCNRILHCTQELFIITSRFTEHPHSLHTGVHT